MELGHIEGKFGIGIASDCVDYQVAWTACKCTDRRTVEMVFSTCIHEAHCVG